MLTALIAGLAYGVMLRTRAQLIAMHGNLDHAHMAGLLETAEWLKATAYMVEMAYLRVLVSAAAAQEKGVKFKGVHYEAARRVTASR
jgi:hypothetical protein